MEVKILGLSLEKEQVKNSQPIDRSKDIIGTWYDERPYVGAQLLLYRKNGNLYIDTSYDDGSSATTKLLEKSIGSANRLENVEGSSFGEYWMLDGKRLQIFDSEGLITTYRAG